MSFQNARGGDASAVNAGIHQAAPSGDSQKTVRKMDAVEYFEIDSSCLDLKHLLTNEGGLGEVWVADLREGGVTHRVAVKKYPSAFADEEIEMFRRETSVLFMAATRCHTVCKVYGTTVKENKMCIVMKLYKESMNGLMRRYPEGKLPMQEVKRYGSEICKAVAELHEQNIISQDLKPPNFLIDDLDHCVVADFGISKIVHGTFGGHMPSNVQGTFNYMSPEAFDPEQFGGVTFRTDSWSFACSLLEMMTGTKPFNGIKMAPIVRKVCKPL
jgi:serine/threonine protein kinase